VGLFRRRKETLAERLLREGGLAGGGTNEAAERELEPPQGPLDPLARRFVDSDSRAVTHRLREWDVVASANAPAVPGSELSFVALPGGALVVEDDVGDADLGPLAAAVEARLQPPYRARAVRQSDRLWAVSANRIEIARLPLEADVVDLTVHDDVRTLRVDGERTRRSVAELERLGEREGSAYAVHAERIDDDLWEVRVSPL
jgi:hypothetical protein